jgi:hypothetical protein
MKLSYYMRQYATVSKSQDNTYLTLHIKTIKARY